VFSLDFTKHLPRGKYFLAMKAKLRTEITMETEETTTIRFPQSETMIFCDSCNGNTRHISIVQAEQVLSLSEQAISHLAGGKQIHSVQNADGMLLLCCNSLAALDQI